VQGLVLFIHILVSFLLIIIVLLQSGKSADLAGAFGGMGSQSTFGPRGAASILSKLTTTLAIMFMITSLVLYIGAARQGKPDKKLDNLKQPGQVTDTQKGKKETPQQKEAQTDKTKQEQGKEEEGNKKTSDTKAKEKKDSEKKTENK